MVQIVYVTHLGYEPILTNIRLFLNGNPVDYMYEEESLAIELAPGDYFYFKVHFFKSKTFSATDLNGAERITVEYLSPLLPLFGVRRYDDSLLETMEDIQDGAYSLYSLKRIFKHRSMFEVNFYRRSSVVR